jgi:hypothetical protein
LHLHCYSTQDGGCNQTEVLRDGASTYCRVTIYHGYLIVPTNNHADILSPQEYITEIYHTDILSDRIIKFYRCFKIHVYLAFFYFALLYVCNYHTANYGDGERLEVSLSSLREIVRDNTILRIEAT